MQKLALIICLLAFMQVGCSKSPTSHSDMPTPNSNVADMSQLYDSGEDSHEEPDTGEEQDVDTEKRAEVVEVDITGESGAYTFAVTIESPDTGCDQYADWWEVVTEDGELVYRRILAHSHVNEQPFTRSGGPVDIAEEDNIIVRVHMNNTGYSPFAAWIAPGGALEVFELEDDFAADLENADPQPQDCAF